MILGKGFLNSLRQYVQRSAEEVIKQYDKIASGATIESIEVFVERNNSKSISVLTSIGGAALYIEQGRSSGSTMPPISAIEEWMADKGIDSTEVPPYVIARSIAEKGIEPLPLTDYIEEKIEATIGDKLETEIYNNLEIEIDALIDLPN